MAQDYAGRLRGQALLPRVLTAVIGIPLVLLLLWLGGPWWMVLAGAIVVLGVLEFARLQALSRAAEIAMGGAAVLGFIMVATFSPAAANWAIAVWAVVLFVLGLVPLLRTGLSPSAPRLSRTHAVILGLAYLAVPFAALVRWRQEHSAVSVVAFLLVIWANDIAAYFVGLAVGRHKMAPRISPGKSWEGALGGLAGGVVAGLLLRPALALGGEQAAAWAAVVTIVSQAGDLLESALKRRAGVKDSGRLLPGHGGVLDRFDGLLLAAPVAYLLLRLLARP